MARTITQQQWRETHADYKTTKEDGTRWILSNEGAEGTCLVQVDVRIESRLWPGTFISAPDDHPRDYSDRCDS